MRKFFKQFGFLPLVVMAVFIANACSSDDDKNNDGDTTVIDGGTVYTSQVVTVARENLTQEMYEGTFNGNTIQLSNPGNNELEFVVLSSMAMIGSDNFLEIPSLDLKVKYNVLQTSLPVSAEETLQPFVVNLNNVETVDSPQGDKVQNFIESFNQYYSSLSDTEKQEMAEFYYVNKELFDHTFSFAGRSSEDAELVANITACEATKGLFVSLGAIAALTFSTAPPVSILAAAGAVVAFDSAVDNCHNFMTAKIKQAFAKIANPDSGRGVQFNEEEFIQLENEVTKTLSVINGKRAVQSSDSGSGNSYITTFFSTVTAINGFIASTLNALIDTYNDYAPSYFQLEPFDNIDVPNNSPVNEQPLTQEEYNKFSFSVASSNVAIQSISYNNGSVNLKLKITDLSQVGENGISTSLKYTYTDEFNNNQGSFPIKVNIDTSDFLIGTWTLTSVDGTPANQYNSISECSGEGGDWYGGVTLYGTATFTQNTFDCPVGRNQVARYCDTNEPIEGLHYNNPNSYPHSGIYESNGNYQFTVLSNSNGITSAEINVIDENTITITVSDSGINQKIYVRQ